MHALEEFRKLVASNRGQSWMTSVESMMIIMVSADCAKRIIKLYEWPTVPISGRWQIQIYNYDYQQRPINMRRSARLTTGIMFHKWLTMVMTAFL